MRIEKWKCDKCGKELKGDEVYPWSFTVGGCIDAAGDWDGTVEEFDLCAGCNDNFARFIYLYSGSWPEFTHKRAEKAVEWFRTRC